MGLYEDVTAAVKAVIDAHVARDTEVTTAYAAEVAAVAGERDTARQRADAAELRAAELQLRLDDCLAGSEPPPSRRTLVGSSMQGNGDPAPLEKACGTTLGMHVTYWDLDQIDKAVAQAKADHAVGRVPWLSMKAPTVTVGGRQVRLTWAQMTAGQADAKVRDYAAKLAALDAEVWNTWHAEPQGDADGTSDDFRRMQDRLNPLLPENVDPWLVLIAYNTYGSANAAYALDKWFPASAMGLGMNFYNPFGTLPEGATRRVTNWRELSLYADKIAQDAKDRGVAWAIRETGLTDQGQADPRGAGWFTRNYRAAAENAIQKAAGWNYFNSSANSIGSWPLTGAKLQQYAGVLAESKA